MIAKILNDQLLIIDLSYPFLVVEFKTVLSATHHPKTSHFSLFSFPTHMLILGCFVVSSSVYQKDKSIFFAFRSCTWQHHGQQPTVVVISSAHVVENLIEVTGLNKIPVELIYCSLQLLMCSLALAPVVKVP